MNERMNGIRFVSLALFRSKSKSQQRRRTQDVPASRNSPYAERTEQSRASRANVQGVTRHNSPLMTNTNTPHTIFADRERRAQKSVTGKVLNTV
jgi:hypothetical protein